MYTNGWSLVRNKKEEDDYGDVLSYHTYDSFYQAFLGHIERRVEFIIANKMKYYRDRYKICLLYTSTPGEVVMEVKNWTVMSPDNPDKEIVKRCV